MTLTGSLKENRFLQYATHFHNILQLKVRYIFTFWGHTSLVIHHHQSFLDHLLSVLHINYQQPSPVKTTAIVPKEHASILQNTILPTVFVKKVSLGEIVQSSQLSSN